MTWGNQAGAVRRGKPGLGGQPESQALSSSEGEGREPPLDRN